MTSSTILSNDPSDQIAGVALTLRTHPRARRMLLRFDDKRGGLTLTVPPRTSRRAALAWAAGQSAWVEIRLARRPAALPLVPGAIIPLEGDDIRLEWVEGASRTVFRSPGVLRCGGPHEAFPARVEAWLKRFARDTLSTETAEFALKAGVKITAVSVGDADSRWGSCSAAGAIRYSWRLILAPPAARRFVVAHEVAHRVHMDHGAAFKRLESELNGGGVIAARGLLRRVGPVIRRVGRG